MKKVTLQFLKQANHHVNEINWLLSALIVLMLGIFVNSWFMVLLMYGLGLKAFNITPKYFILGPNITRHPVGYVFDAKTSKPIALAIVRLYNSSTNRLIQTKVTNEDGEFDFLIPEGNYFIEVTKTGYQFPSSRLEGYTGGQICVTKEKRYYIFQHFIFLDPRQIVAVKEMISSPVQNQELHTTKITQ